jgi:hypothetical protein
MATLLSTTALALGVWSVGCGTFGYQSGMRRVEEAVAAVNPKDRQTILAVGESEASIDWKYGLLAGAIPLIGGALAFGLGLARLSRGDHD